MAITRIKTSNIEDGTVIDADVAADAITATKIADGAVTDAKIAAVAATKLTGTVAGARLPATLPAASAANLTSIPAANLTGTIADARIPASAVTQHVTATDLTPVHQSIATLGLHMGVADNKVAYNLPNSFIDTFEDDSGITTKTTVGRDTTGEYVSTFYTVYGSDTEWDYVSSNIWMQDKSGGTTMSSNSYALGNTGAPSWFQKLWQTLSTGSQANYWGSPSTGFASGMFTDYGANYRWSKCSIGKARSYGDIRTFRLRYSTDGSNWTVVDMTGASVDSYHGSTSPLPPSGGGEVTNFDSTGEMDWEATGTGDRNVGAIISGFTPFIARYIEFAIGTYDSNQNSNVGFSNWRWWYTPATTTTNNTTGTLISDTQTAPSATTDVSGVILYKDNAGTATLGTHLKIYFTADNGTNWTEAASYGTAQTFSGTTKQVKLGKTTVTSGTQVAMKAVWASQASGTMETQLHGWAVNY